MPRQALLDALGLVVRVAPDQDLDAVGGTVLMLRRSVSRFWGCTGLQQDYRICVSLEYEMMI